MIAILAILFRILKVVLVLLLPFMALIRGAVYVHTRYELGAVISILSGLFFCVLVLLLYYSLIFERVTDRFGSAKAFSSRAKFIAVFVLGFIIHGVFFIGTGNMKSTALSKSVRQLHPIIRLAVSTVIIVDRDLIITDGSRTPEDYRRMGLPSKKNSLHYRQPDGYAYAIDLRTNRRSAWRNALIRTYFRIMGFRTLRHVGTDDHLHVSLYCPYLPRSL